MPTAVMPAGVFAVQCPNPKCRKYMLVEEGERNKVVPCLLCKTPIRVGGPPPARTPPARPGARRKRCEGTPKPRSGRDPRGGGLARSEGGGRDGRDHRARVRKKDAKKRLRAHTTPADAAHLVLSMKTLRDIEVAERLLA